jgi:hypothetical protein
MQISATGYEIGTNSPQPFQPGPAVVKVRESNDPEWSAKTCQSYSSPQTANEDHIGHQDNINRIRIS